MCTRVNQDIIYECHHNFIKKMYKDSIYIIHEDGQNTDHPE